MERKEKAAQMFNTSHNCAQSVLTSFSDKTGLTEDLSCRISCAFGAGGGRRQYQCGAVSGALLAISAVHGRGLHDDSSVQDKTYSLTRDFLARFEAKHGTIECRKLLDGADLMTPEGQTRFKSENMKKDRCTIFVTDAVEILEGII
jgi:C_GCAxxG_C_C family probable redox protein